jgi:hypothetical protein
MARRKDALYRDRMELNVTASASLDWPLDWYGYVVRCPSCGASEGLTLRAGTKPGHDEDNAGWADVRCPAGDDHDFEHPLVYPDLVRYAAGRRREGEPAGHMPGWLPHVRSKFAREGPDVPDRWMNWERADYSTSHRRYADGHWQRHWPALVGAAYSGLSAGLTLDDVPYTIATTLKQNPDADPAARWEVRLNEEREGRTGIVIGPDPATAVCQQVYGLLDMIAEGKDIDEVTVDPPGRYSVPGWPWTVHVTMVVPFPGTRTEDGAWICARYGHIFLARQADVPETSGAAQGSAGEHR